MNTGNFRLSSVEYELPVEDMHLPVGDRLHQAAVDMRHQVPVVVGMRYLAADTLVPLMDSHLLVDRSADMLIQVRMVDTLLGLDSGNLVFDLDSQELEGIDPLDWDTVPSLADIQVEVDRQVGTHQVVVVHVAVDPVDSLLDLVVVATTF